jgi:ribbon-helix-helix CopG family protein
MTHRLQISITDTQYDVLNTEANRTGLSIAELIRRLVDGKLRPDARPRVQGYELSLGLWKRPDAAVAGRRPGIKLDD